MQCTAVDRSASITESKNELNCKTRHKLIHKYQDLDFYFLLQRATLIQTQTSKFCHFLINMYAGSISTIQILKTYGFLKYIANISGLTALARYRSEALFSVTRRSRSDESHLLTY